MYMMGRKICAGFEQPSLGFVETSSFVLPPLSWRKSTVRTFFENSLSVINTQRAFRRHFNIPIGVNVPHGNAIRRWARVLKNTGSTAIPRTIGRPRTVKTPENVNLVKAAIEQSPSCSARKHAIALGMYNRSLRRIMHVDLQFHL